MEIKPDCRHYLGDRPCKVGEICECVHYEPMGTRILIIKLGALGDVVRTTCLLPTLKMQYPVSHITWVSTNQGVSVLSGHPLIDCLVPVGSGTVLQQHYDIVLSLDKEPRSAALCNAIHSEDKRGIELSPYGTVVPIENRCLPYFMLGLDDDLKFRCNTKSYPELIHEAVGLDYARVPYRLYPDRAYVEIAGRVFEARQRPIVGLNLGSGDAFVNKAPRREHWLEILGTLSGAGYSVAILGGPKEFSVGRWLDQKLPSTDIIHTGCHNQMQQFIAFIQQCDVVVTGDTLALHVALAQDVPVVALFGPTCEQEIDLFGLGMKIVSPVSCGPCYRHECDKSETCMDAIPADKILSAVRSVLGVCNERVGG